MFVGVIIPKIGKLFLTARQCHLVSRRFNAHFKYSRRPDYLLLPIQTLDLRSGCTL